jgi:Response regulator containing CheY-like receiver, AAA-type ATPase, and DNA-binding domains
MISILYVDDEPVVCDVVKIFLERGGNIFVNIAYSAEDALVKLKHSSFDLIVSDYQLPKINGIEFLKIVRLNSSIPFIIFTGKGCEEVAVEAINNGANYYLIKGGDPNVAFKDLENKIKTLVQKSLDSSGNELLIKGDFKTAIDFFNAALEKNPNDPNPLIHKAMAFYKIGKFDDAIECCNKALLINPNLNETWFLKGFLLANHNQKDGEKFHKIFISYCNENKEIAYTLCSYLEEQNLKCWIAPRDIEPMTIWPEEIIQAIQKCKIVIILLSTSANQSDNVLRELILASEQKKEIVPVRIENIVASDRLRFFLQIWQYIDVFDGDLLENLKNLSIKMKTRLQ